MEIMVQHSNEVYVKNMQLFIIEHTYFILNRP